MSNSCNSIEGISPLSVSAKEQQEVSFPNQNPRFFYLPNLEA